VQLFVTAHPKFMVFLGLAHVMIQASGGKSRIKTDDRLIELERKFARTMRDAYERAARDSAFDFDHGDALTARRIPYPAPAPGRRC
jgi:hypothetical protein